ncbi:hypothetical protein HDU97_006434, partial [Phlyctochytrium planicorne]
MASTQTLRSSPTPFDGIDEVIGVKGPQSAEEDAKGANDAAVGTNAYPEMDGSDKVDGGHLGSLGSGSLWSIITLEYLKQMMKVSDRRALVFEDLPRLKKKDQIEALTGSFDSFEAEIQDHLSKEKKDPSTVKMLPVLFAFGWSQLSLFLLTKLFKVLASLYIPFILKALIVYLQKKKVEEKSFADGTETLAALLGFVSSFHFGSEGRPESPVPLNETMQQSSSGLFHEKEEFQPVNWVPFTDSGLGLCFLLFAVFLARMISDVVSNEVSIKLSTTGSNMLGAVAYRKSLRLSHSASRVYDNAFILSLVNIECREVISAFVECIECLVLPVHVLLAIFGLISLLGLAVYPSAIVIVVSILLMAAISFQINKSVRAYQKSDEARISSIWELLIGIKAIKLESQEEARSRKTRLARDRQMKAVMTAAITLTLLMVMISLPSMLMPIASFVVYALKNGEIDAAIVFPALMFFEPLLEPVQDLPDYVLGVLGGIHAFKKVKSFMLAEEHQKFQVDESDEMDSDVAIEFKNATLKWEARRTAEGHNRHGSNSESMDFRDKETDTGLSSGDGVQEKKDESRRGRLEDHHLFQDLNLKIPMGKLTIIVGVVGSGKSSLMSACLGEMTLISGSVKARGNMALCEQQPWLQSRSVEENILFGNAKDEPRLKKVVQCCGLDRDVEQMAYGLQTQIGEKGVTLSGGQKARIALARAVYDHDAEVFLLDDPLSALDARVGALVFDECVLRFLAGKTRVLVTHQIQVLPRADYIVVVDNGRVVEQGTYQELIRANLDKGGTLKALMEKYTASKGPKISRRRPLPRRQDSIVLTKSLLDRSAVTTNSAIASTYEEGIENCEEEEEHMKHVFHQNHLIAPEDSGLERLDKSFIKPLYKMVGGTPVAATCLVMVLLSSGSSLARELWLTWWTEQTIGISNNSYAIGYAVIGAFSALSFGALAAITAYGGTVLAKQVHNQALDGLLKAKLSFYDSQPLGRILARMTRDFAEVDVQFWLSCMNLFVNLAMFISAAGALIYSNHYSVIVLALIAFAQYFLTKRFRKAFRDLKRITALERSPVSSHMSECLNGAVTLRAFKAESKTVHVLYHLKDRFVTCRLITESLFNWLSMRHHFLISLFVLFISLYGVLSRGFSPSLFGLAVQAGDQLSTFMFIIIHFCISLEVEFVAVERVLHYCFNLPQEAPFELPKDPSPDAWPKLGGIEMTDVSIKYESMDEPVVKNLSLSIRPGEKIGIVGRTGSGKSTLISALFRLLELHEGKIEIDG